MRQTHVKTFVLRDFHIFSTKDIKNIQWNTSQAGHEAAKKVIELGYSKKRIGIELCNTPTDTYIALKKKKLT